MKNLYGVFAGTKWCLCTNRRTATKLARRVSGEVRAITSAYASVFDAPTFYALSERIADYREERSNG
jgi:hypothetical protein